MLQVETKVIAGLKFQFQPMPVLKAARLDKRVLTLIAPVIGGFKGIRLDMEISDVDMDLEAVARGVALALQTLPDSEFTGLLSECLGTVVYLPEGGAPMMLVNEEQLSQVFTGKLDALYRVVVEVMRYNRFTPFAWAELGGGLSQILGSKKEPKKAPKSGLALAKSVTSAPN